MPLHMWWKLYFWITIIEAVLGFLGIFITPGYHIATQIIMAVIFLVAVIGMYSYAFRKKLLTQLFWQYFTGIYVLIDLIYLVYAAAPQAQGISALSFLSIYKETSFVDTLIGVGLDLPLIYALFRLTKDKPYRLAEKKVSAKNTTYRWGMLQTALWGYSIVLVFYLLLTSFFPSADTTVTKHEAADPYNLAGTFVPLMLFWLWVIAKYKQYKWNWWRTTLAANGLLYSGMIFWGILFPQKEQAVQSGFMGIDIISLLQLLIMLLGLWVFGRTQFVKEENKA